MKPWKHLPRSCRTRFQPIIMNPLGGTCSCVSHPMCNIAYLHWRQGSTMPDDTWLVAEHHSRQGSLQGPYYFAHKIANNWIFGAATPDGWLLATTNVCITCHAEAPADNVFGLLPIATVAAETKTTRRWIAAGSSKENGTVSSKKSKQANKNGRANKPVLTISSVSQAYAS